jgi:hypothetical protein
MVRIVEHRSALPNGPDPVFEREIATQTSQSTSHSCHDRVSKN